MSGRKRVSGRKSSKDNLNLQAKPSAPNHMCRYVVNTLTRDESEAGTDNTPTIIIYGTKGETKELRMDNPNVDDFKRGKWSTFEFQGKRSDVGNVGYPVSIRLHMKGDDDWAFERIRVTYYTDPNHNWPIYTRTAHFWVDSAVGDGDFTDSKREHTFTPDDMQAISSSTYKYLLSDTWEVFDWTSSPSPYTYNTNTTHKITAESWARALETRSFKSTTKVAASYSRKMLGGKAKFEVEEKIEVGKGSEDESGSKKGAEFTTSRSDEFLVPVGYLVFFRVQKWAEGNCGVVKKFGSDGEGHLLDSEVRIVTHVQPTGFALNSQGQFVLIEHRLPDNVNSLPRAERIPMLFKTDTKLEDTKFQKIYEQLDWQNSIVA